MAFNCRILQEDGSVLLQEDGTSDFLVENCSPSAGTDTGCNLLLETGGLLLQEDGASGILVETCEAIVITPSGGTFLIPKGFRVPLESDDDLAIATSLVALMRRRRWRLDG